MREILFYRTEQGKSPVVEFLDSLSSKQVQKVAWVLRLIEEIDTVPTAYLKKLVNTQDIWEVRVQHFGNIFRLLGFFLAPTQLVLTSGFQKKTQKTPPAEIKLSEARKQNYLKRIKP